MIHCPISITLEIDYWPNFLDTERMTLVIILPLIRILNYSMHMVRLPALAEPISICTDYFVIALVTGQLAVELEEVGRYIVQLYGTLDEDSLKLR